MEENQVQPAQSLIMEIDETLSFKGKDISLKSSEAKDIYKAQYKNALTPLDDYVTSFSKVQVLVCNISDLKALIHKLLPKCVRL